MQEIERRCVPRFQICFKKTNILYTYPDWHFLVFFLSLDTHLATVSTWETSPWHPTPWCPWSTSQRTSCWLSSTRVRISKTFSKQIAQTYTQEQQQQQHQKVNNTTWNQRSRNLIIYEYDKYFKLYICKIARRIRNVSTKKIANNIDSKTTTSSTTTTTQQNFFKFSYRQNKNQKKKNILLETWRANFSFQRKFFIVQVSINDFRAMLERTSQISLTHCIICYIYLAAIKVWSAERHIRT